MTPVPDFDPRDFARASRSEWLETNGTGAFAMGSAAGLNTRRYHALLIASLRPPVERRVLLSRVEDTIRYEDQDYALATVQYPGTLALHGYRLMEAFRTDPPTWVYRAGAARVEKTLFLIEGRQGVVLRYLSDTAVTLEIRPFLADRDYHALERQREDFRSPLHLHAPGASFSESPCWYRDHEYIVELERGLDYREDLYTPGVFRCQLEPGQPAFFIASLEKTPPDPAAAYEARLRRPAHHATPFLARRHDGRWTILAGFPWFTDWGRDAMIALPGLLLARDSRPDIARSVLESFAGHARHGLIPNRFPDSGEQPEYNTADATLWWFVAAHRYLKATADRDFLHAVFLAKAREILDHHRRGTLHGIGVDRADGLLRAGAPDSQLTWMDARVHGVPVTPRDGKAVEINALWFNALRITSHWARHARAHELAESCFTQASKLRRNFCAAFWSPALHCLRDTDSSPQIRPNQIFAAALPFTPLEDEDRKAVVRAVLHHLLTPYGLRTLAPTDPDYCPRYAGSVEQRDAAYHQGTVWPWLLGPFIDAFLNTFGRSARNIEWCRDLLLPLAGHIHRQGCLGSIAEVFDGDAPHAWGGAPAQAWSVAEYERLRHELA